MRYLTSRKLTSYVMQPRGHGGATNRPRIGLGSRSRKFWGSILGIRHVRAEVARMIASWIKDGTLKEVLRPGPQRKLVPHVVPASWSDEGKMPEGQRPNPHVAGTEEGDE